MLALAAAGEISCTLTLNIPGDLMQAAGDYTVHVIQTLQKPDKDRIRRLIVIGTKHISLPFNECTSVDKFIAEIVGQAIGLIIATGYVQCLPVRLLLNFICDTALMRLPSALLMVPIGFQAMLSSTVVVNCLALHASMLQRLLSCQTCSGRRIRSLCMLKQALQ